MKRRIYRKQIGTSSDDFAVIIWRHYGTATTQAWGNLVLVWIGFGTVVGFLANMFLPAGNPSGFFGNLVVGITGSCVGPVVLVLILSPEHFHPMSPVGLIAAVLAGILLLVSYRSLTFFVRGAAKKG